MNRAKVCPIGILVIILFAALGFRLLYFWAARAGPLGNIDSAEYEDLASRFTEHRAYVGGIGIGGFPSDLQPSRNLSVLKLIGRTRVAVVQFVLFVALLAMTGTLLVNEFRMTGIVYATDWPTNMYTPSTLADSRLPSSWTANCLQALADQRRSSWLSLGSGVFLGLAVLVKPVGQVVVSSFSTSWILQRRLLGVISQTAANQVANRSPMPCRHSR